MSEMRVSNSRRSAGGAAGCGSDGAGTDALYSWRPPTAVCSEGPFTRTSAATRRPGPDQSAFGIPHENVPRPSVGFDPCVEPRRGVGIVQRRRKSRTDSNDSPSSARRSYGLFVDVCPRKWQPRLCQNCVRCPPELPSNTVTYRERTDPTWSAGSRRWRVRWCAKSAAPSPFARLPRQYLRDFRAAAPRRAPRSRSTPKGHAVCSRGCRSKARRCVRTTTPVRRSTDIRSRAREIVRGTEQRGFRRRPSFVDAQKKAASNASTAAP